MKKVALITGVTGQDGSYLAKFLLKKNYIVHGIKRRSSSFNTSRIEDIYEDIFKKNKKFFLHYGDMVDSSNLSNIICKIEPTEIYNLAAQSHVQVSFETPEYTADVDALGTLRILEILKSNKKLNKTKFYQASTSEMYGNIKSESLNEKNRFEPVSPYGSAKLYAYWITRNYRDAYNIHASNGILFNHESPLRGETFVSRKITMFVAKYLKNKEQVLYLGNLYAKRDWGHAKDYVEGMWKILQQKNPGDYVLSTNQTWTVKKFAEMAFKLAGIKIVWRGKGINETGIDPKTKKIVIKVSKKYFRPNELEILKGNSALARKILKWKPKINFKSLIQDMLTEDIKKINGS